MSSGAAPADHDALIAQLAAITGQAPAEAEQYLTAGDWNLETAAALYFEGEGAGATQEEPEIDADVDMAGEETTQPTSNPQQQAGGGRTLGGDYVSGPAASSSSQPASSRQAPQRGLRTLKDLQGQSGGQGQGHGHAHDDGDRESDEDYKEDDENQDFFAGGEKSGLAVQNPNATNPRDHINSILRRARQNVPRPGGDDEQPTSRFHGTGMTLGGDDAPSRAIPDPNADIAPPAPRAHRELHLWRDGFSVDDGPLYRYDDPANARTLEMINSGHAPLHILNVEPGQEVDVEVHPHKDEDYKKPKRKYVPFSGSGQRLGSPTPGGTPTPPPAQPASSAPMASTSTASAAPSVTIDDSVPTLTLQIRLGDGTRLTSRFNTTHTIGDVYSFVDASSPASTQRAYVLMTTFPSKEMTDKTQVLGDLSEFKRGGAMVQKWK